MTTVADLTAAYLAEPGPETLAALRRAARGAGNYRPDLTPGGVLGPLLRDAAYDEVVRAAGEMMPGALFSPSVHLALAEAHARLGDRATSERESTLARAAVQSILDSGDGSLERPWSVLRLSDEYDVLRFLRTHSEMQQLVDHEHLRIDRHTCADGATYHFDVTDLV